LSFRLGWLAVAVCASSTQAQQQPDMRPILERLDRLEQQNVALLAEIRELRQQIASLTGAANTPPAARAEEVEKLADQVAVHSARIAEQAQSKVESLQRFPIRITGMALFNAYTNSRSDGGYFSPVATAVNSARGSGGTLSQSILGLEFFGPGTLLGGKINGNLQMDFYPYSSAYGLRPDQDASGAALSPRLRTGSITIDWGSRSIMFGQEKPLISPRDPDSLAQVGAPPLAAAGNLWEWRPQVRLQQRFNVSDGTTITAQGAVYETDEYNTGLPAQFASTLELARPGWEGRVEFAHRSGDESRFELAPGFHYSVSHAAGYSVTSHIASLDGLLRPFHFAELTGAFFAGQDAAGLGGLGPGFRVTDDGDLYGVNSRGGWLQLALFPAPRLTLHLFGGTQVNRRSDLSGYYPQSNISFAANAYYRLAPNVFLAFEAAQSRTEWTSGTTHLRNHYDLALAYMF